MGILLKDRVYELIIGDYKTGQGIKVTDLQVRFDVSKSADNKRKANSAVIEVYNLSEQSLQLVQTDFLNVKFSVGFATTGLKLLATGNVTEVRTRRAGPDRVTQFVIGEGYVDLNHQKLSAVVPVGKTVEDVIEEIRRTMPGVNRGVYTGTNLNNPVMFGYPLTGNPKIALAELCEANRLEYRLDRGVLSISDENTTPVKDLSIVPKLTPTTGLVETPFFASDKATKDKKDKTRKPGIQFQALLNAELSPGDVVYIESSSVNGYFRINHARYYGDFRGNDWYIEAQCSELRDGKR